MNSQHSTSQALGPDIAGGSLSRNYNRVTTLLDYLGRTLLSLGTPAFRVEAAFSLFAERMKLDLQVMATPTMLIATVRGEVDERTVMVRENAGPTDLGKLARLADVLNELAADRLEVAEACRRAADIYRSPNRVGPLMTLMAFVISSAAAVLLLGGGWPELALAAQLGVVAGLVNFLSRIYPAMGRLNVLVASFTISLLANIYCAWVPGVSYSQPIVAGLITLLPGLSITTATRELAIGHVLSGSTRLAGALVVLLAMVFGVLAGVFVSDLFFQEPPIITPQPVSDWVMFLMTPIMGIGLCLRFRAAFTDWLPIIATCLFTMTMLYAFREFEEPVISVFIIAAILGFLGNVYARVRHRPGTIVQLPGLLLLVPGSLSLFSFAALMQSEVITGLEELMRAMLIAVAIAMGLVVSSVLMPPRTDL